MVSITTDAVSELGRALNARAHAVRTQINTSSIEGAVERLNNAIDQAEAISLDGLPDGVNPNVWEAFQVSLRRAMDTERAVVDQELGLEQPEDTWETFTGPTQGTPSGSVMTFGLDELRYQARQPRTSGTQDLVGAPSKGTSLVRPTTSLTSGKGSAVEAFRLANTVGSSPGAPWYTNPVYLGGAAAGIVGLYFLYRN